MRWFLILTILCAPAWACSCGGYPSAKDAWLDSPLVFVGIVEKTDPKIEGKLHPPAAEQVAWVRIIEPFKGVKKDQVLELRDQLNSCSGGFLEGMELLFYLHHGHKLGTWGAPVCHRTRRIIDAVDDLRFLRGLPASARGNRVSGIVNLSDEGAGKGVDENHPISGVRVRAVATANTYETVTDADGFYEFRDLQPGTYKIQIDNPKGTTLRFPMGYGKLGQERYQRLRLGAETQLEVTAESGNGFDFILSSDTKISGRVFDPDGRPMKGVCIDVELVADSQEAVSTISSCTKTDGSYVHEKMAPGSYRIVANRYGTMSAAVPFGKLYHPGTPDVRKGTILNVNAGQHLDGVDFRVPALAPRIELRGRLTFGDGVPIPRQSLEFRSDDGHYLEHGRSDKNGNFVMQVLAGRPGSLTSNILIWREDRRACPQFPLKLNPNGFDAGVESSSYRIAGEANISGLEVVFPYPACEPWLKREEAGRKF